jgi:ABC-2 type transport system permease protein
VKKILAIAFKDNLVRFSSPGEWVFFLVLPVIFSVVINMATGSQGDSRIALLVVDQDGGELARDLVDVLKESKTVAIKEETLAEAESKFRSRQAPAMLVIPAGLEDAKTSGNSVDLQFTEAAGNVDSVAARQAVLAALGSLGRTLQAAGINTAAAEEIRPFADQAARDAYFLKAKENAQALFSEQPERITVTGPALAAKEEDFWSPPTQASAGTVVTWVFIPLLAISEFFAHERTLGTLRRLLSAPVSKATYLLGTISGQLDTDVHSGRLRNHPVGSFLVA